LWAIIDLDVLPLGHNKLCFLAYGALHNVVHSCVSIKLPILHQRIIVMALFIVVDKLRPRYVCSPMRFRGAHFYRSGPKIC
jgi:hypothetical protein